MAKTCGTVHAWPQAAWSSPKTPCQPSCSCCSPQSERYSCSDRCTVFDSSHRSLSVAPCGSRCRSASDGRFDTSRCSRPARSPHSRREARGAVPDRRRGNIVACPIGRRVNVGLVMFTKYTTRSIGGRLRIGIVRVEQLRGAAADELRSGDDHSPNGRLPSRASAVADSFARSSPPVVMSYKSPECGSIGDEGL